MEDYDWLVPATSFDQWTHRSQHPDTRLDHFFSGEAALGYELANSGDARVRLQTGFKYTDVQWSAYGGSYIYSDNGFRDKVGNFADGEPGITYRQQLPELFIGVDGDQTYGNLRVGGLLRGGITAFASATDNHWMRDLLFEDQFRVAPTFTAGLDLNYALGPMAEIFIAGRYDRAFTMRGRTEVFNTNTGALVSANDDAAGGDLQSVEITTGLKGRF
jgi:outer membrane protease